MLEKSSDPYLGLSWDEMRVNFEASDYVTLYPDVKQAGMDPFEHYINFGWKEDRLPWRNFDAKYYRKRHMPPNSRVCPLAHFTAIGKPGKLAVNEEQENYDGWLTTVEANWQQELARLLGALGYDAERFTNDAFGLYIRKLFSAKAYRAAKGLDARVSDTECFIRYLVFDFETGMPPGPLFDPEVYLREASAKGLMPIPPGQTAFEHWLHRGVAAKITPNDLFAGEEYAALNKDLENFPGLLFCHFVLHGLGERRQFMRDVLMAHDLEKTSDTTSQRFVEAFGSNRAALDELGAMRRFRRSAKLRRLTAQACAIDPDVSMNGALPGFLPPWHDGSFLDFKAALECLPEGRFDAVVLVPFCKVGGADYVAGILAKALSGLVGSVLVIQTDQSDWARPDWFGDVARADLSDVLSGLDQDRRTQILYELLRRVAPRHVFNVNSRLAFDTFVRFGKRLNRFTRLHAYYFCADRTPKGVEVGYPVWYFANVFEHLATAITDSADLAGTLAQRYCLTPQMRERLVPVYTPAKIPGNAAPVVDLQLDPASRRRPTLIWAGRFDRQKRFDLLLEVAQELPHVDFLCWGKAVLDAPPDLSNLPANIRLNAPFTDYSELPLWDVDGFFYTSDWDGIPTILIELGGFGMPIVASASGGVPELITAQTGWTVPVGSPASTYAQVIEEMLANPEQRRARAHALQARVREQHSETHYATALKTLLEGK